VSSSEVASGKMWFPMRPNKGEKGGPVCADRRKAAGLLIAALLTLTAWALGTADQLGGLLVVLTAGGLALAKLFGWRPALVLTLVLLGATSPYFPWHGAWAGRPGDVLRLAIFMGVALAVVVTLRTTRKALGRSEEKYRVVAESASDGIVITDEEGRYLWANLRACEIFGYSRVEMVDVSLGEIVDPEDLRNLPVRPAEGEPGRCVLRECRARRKDGERIMVEMSCRTLMDGRFMAIVRDVTERKRAEDELKASLHEKDVLLREVHHRVKNNLQVVSSLLHLQARYVQDPDALARFTESLERIKAIALLHEKLYLSKNVARIDFAEYLPNLVSSLVAAYRAEADGVKVDVEVGDVSLDLESAVPCGLIVTELVTNALKYAYPAGRGGTIRVELLPGEGRGLVLRVADDGIGMPEVREIGSLASLGLRLVTTLVQQLNGKLEARRNGGTEFRIAFSPGRAGTEAAGKEEYEYALSTNSRG
jgi:PAS domain S-box-containing protein